MLFFLYFLQMAACSDYGGYGYGYAVDNAGEDDDWGRAGDFTEADHQRFLEAKRDEGNRQTDSTQPSFTVVVSNLAPGTVEQEVASKFADLNVKKFDFGNLAEKQFRGFVCIEFEDESSMEKALMYNNNESHIIHGKMFKVERTIASQQNSGGFGGRVRVQRETGGGGRGG